MNEKEIIGKRFYTSWGYDQTNYDFLVVLGISKSGKTAICKEVKTPHGKDEPVGIPFKMRIQQANGNLYLRGTYYKTYFNVSKRFRLGTFYAVEPNREYEETPFYLRH